MLLQARRDETAEAGLAVQALHKTRRCTNRGASALSMRHHRIVWSLRLYLPQCACFVHLKHTGSHAGLAPTAMPAEKGVKTPRTGFLQRLSDAAYVLNHLKWPEVQALHASAQLRAALPTRNKRKRDEDTKMAWPARGRMWQVFNGLPDQPFGDMQPQPKVPAADRPNGSAAAAAHRARENRRDAAKRAVEDMLSAGSAAPVASRLPGTRQINRKPILDRMVNVIMGGVVTAPDGESLMARSEWPLDEDHPIPPVAERIFRGLGECEKLSEAFAADRASLKIKTQRWCWHILQQHDQRLDTFSMRPKLEREDESVRMTCSVAHCADKAACKLYMMLRRMLSAQDSPPVPDASCALAGDAICAGWDRHCAAHQACRLQHQS